MNEVLKVTYFFSHSSCKWAAVTESSKGDTETLILNTSPEMNSAQARHECVSRWPLALIVAVP